MKDELPIKYYQELLTAKGRKENSAFIIEGIRQVEQFSKSKNVKLLEILAAEAAEPLPFETKTPVRYITRNQLSKITDSKTPNGVIAVAEIPCRGDRPRSPAIPPATKNNILLLEDIQDPGNVGTLIRSAAAFGFSAVILSPACADVYSPKVVRSSGGAICNLEIINKTDIFDCISTLKKQNYRLIVADLDGKNEIAPATHQKTIFALGNEGNGVSEKLRSLADEIFTIPFDNSAVESLNVATAGAIGMFLLKK